MTQKRILIGTLLIAVILGVLPALSLAAPDPAPVQQDEQQPNLAINPGFEGIRCAADSPPGKCHGNYDVGRVHVQDGKFRDNIFTPQEWVVWWREGDPFGQPEVQTIPADDPRYGYDAELPRIHGGMYGLKLFNYYRQQDAGIYQCIDNLEVGSTVQLTAYAHGWSCDESGDYKMGYSCGDKYNQSFRVGIEPNGNADPFAQSIIWNEKMYAPDHFKLIGPISAQVGENGRVCIFLRSKTKWVYKYADAYWDDVSLVKTSDGVPPTSPPPQPPDVPAGPPPTPLPTPTPNPDGSITYVVQSGDTISLISQKTGVSVDTIRELNNSSILEGYIIRVGQELTLALPKEGPSPTEPPAEPAAVAEATADTGGNGEDEGAGEGGTTGTSICVSAFHDRNGDGFRDETNEEILPNATIILADASGVIGQYTTNGIDEPYCFPVAAGSYRVIQNPPATYIASGAAEQAAAVAEGASVPLAFGNVRGGDAAASSAAPEETNGDDGNNATRSVFATIAKVSGVLVILLCIGVAVLFFLNRRQMM